MPKEYPIPLSDFVIDLLLIGFQVASALESLDRINNYSLTNLDTKNLSEVEIRFVRSRKIGGVSRSEKIVELGANRLRSGARE